MDMPAEIMGEGRPLVLLGGGLTGAASWAPFAERLARTRTVIRPQLVGVQLGLDDQPLPADYSPEMEKAAFERSLTSLMQTQGVTPPIDFTGWSAGGAIILDFALDHPEWVRSMTLIEPGAIWVLPSLDDDAQRERDAHAKFPRDHITEDQLEGFLRTMAVVPPKANLRDMPLWPVWSRHRQSLRTLRASWDYQRDRSGLHRLAVPTLLVKGTGSPRWLHQIINVLAEQLPHAQVAEWPGGHAPHVMNMDAFLERMDAFQASVG